MDRPIRILVVDDDPISLDILEANLEPQGFQVMRARDGEEALQLAQRSPPDLVISDILMPNMDGYQLCRELRRDDDLRQVPLIFYSATYTDRADQEFALSLGAARFVSKPEEPDRLEEVIDEVLRAYRSGDLDTGEAAELDEGTYLHRYNRRLVAKLEDKIDQLGRMNRRLEAETERARQAEARIRHLADHDSLTGLHTRARFVADAGGVFRTHGGDGGRWVVVVLDLDAFRDINHTLGHDTGNRLLELIADRLRPGWPAGSVPPARIGQDEFALLLDATTEPDFAGWTRRCLDRLEKPFELDGVVVEVSASAGLAVYPDDGDEAELLLRHAEVALKEGKGSRGSVTRYRADSDPYQPDRLRMIAGLREAIQGEQLLLHYQPKIDLATSRAVGAEALVRWRHPERGLLLPGEFIGLAEQTGQIRALTEWVIRSAARDLARFALRGDGFGLSLNISARNLLDEDLPETLAATFGEVDAPPSMLSLEITESAILRDPQGARQILDRLARGGVGVAIDDFGTGYSSLSHLKELPVRELKIDRSFVTTLAEDRRNAAIVRSTVGLAHDLGLETTAEGVETESVLDLLRSFGCDMAQGFLMARPMPVEQLLEWIEDPAW